MNNKPDMQLIADFRNGNLEAIAELFQRHFPSSLRVARRILPGGDESLDAVQSAYLSAFRNLSSFRGESTFKTWITKIVINQCVMHIRNSRWQRRCVSLDQSHSRSTGAIVVQAVDNTPSPEDLAQRAELHQKFVDTAGTLPRILRDPFVLCTISGLSTAETAKALGLTIPATKTRISRARCLMRSQLKHICGKPNRALREQNNGFPVNAR